MKWISRQNENFFQNLGSINYFSTTKSFKKSYLKIQKVPVFELNRSQGIILRKISIFCPKMNFELYISPKWKLFSKFGLHKLFLYQQNFKKVLFENSKSARFWVKSLARHHFEENINFWSKNDFWTGYYAKMKTFFKIWAP